MRSQKRKDVLWYELYHDLFSGIIEEWNDAYKARQRNRRIAVFGGLFVVAGFLLFAAYDVTRNLTEHHFRLNLKRGISDTVELYRGDAGTTDLLGLQRFEVETQFRRLQIEPDKLFQEKPLADANNLSGELIGYLPSEERVRAYWEAGLVEKALSLAGQSISEDDVRRSKQVISGLAPLGSLEIVDLLSDRLSDEEGSYFLKTELIDGLGRVDLPEATASLAQAVEDDNTAVRTDAIASLEKHRNPKAGEMLLELGKDADSDVRNARGCG